MNRFLHASDLHLGKPFGSYPEDVRGRLRQARQDVIGRLAEAARQGGAHVVLLAGDTFDQQTPAPTTIRHALNAMRAAEGLTWVMLPGNHDSLAATELWRVLAANRPDNVVLAVEPVPQIVGDLAILPAPCLVRHPGRDLTEWMAEAPTDNAIRVGLAHGGVTDFRSAENKEEGPAGVIAPDRAQRARLDYLALGDWHGRLRIGPATWYSGTPEADGFRVGGSVGALLVEIGAPGAAAGVTAVETGSLDWRRIALDLLPGEDAALRLETLLPPISDRSRTLLDVVVSGRTSLARRSALVAGIAATGADFLWQRSDLSALHIDHEIADLDLIDAGGALRTAAEELAAESVGADTEEARRIAETALARLFSYRMEEQ